MKVKKYMLTGSYLLCLFIIPCFSGCKKDSPATPGKKFELSAMPREGWMGQLDSTYSGLTLGELTIPGTHLSGAEVNHLNSEDMAYVTQMYDIYDQLVMGVRFLDIRLGYDTADCKTGLGLYNDEVNDMFMVDDDYLNQSFQSVMSSLEAFLNENPTEMVILLIHQVHSSLDLIDFWGMVTAEIADGGFSSEHIVDYDPTRDAQLPLLSECKHKILLMSTENTTGFAGFTFHWPSNTSGYSELVGNLHCHAQDMSKWDCFVPDEKFGYINQLIDQCRNVPKADQPKNLFINFTSGYDICSDREYIAATMNMATFQYMNDKVTNNNPCGIMVMDFAGDTENTGAQLVDACIAINFMKE
ncbi:MAG: hypothetical protein IH596_10375 [Bacteroidales bacterium]|nr:hypothetical protein [Bacteroidales bacterium]